MKISHLVLCCSVAAVGACQDAPEKTPHTHKTPATPGTPATAETPAPAPACDRDALTDAERAESTQLLEQLGGALAETRPLDDGYAFRIDERRLPLAGLARWVDLERRCCPFFHIAIELEPAGALWLRLTGGDDVKRFIEAELAARR